ncbi:MAG: hypothetical protein HY738_02685 [Bacteroidia bacterium]|nr:hypothetical protein [Bacteroidia bacterium]
MYLAPLNYDRYFKKVFRDTSIAKRFLEDFFDVTIQEIEALPTHHKITDSATAVEFDFRCKIKGSFIIIDMQQWYKTDIVKRFYMYHSMNTVLQLEKIPDKTIDLDKKRKRDIKDYDKLVPVITLIWMVDDTLGFTDDFVSYTVAPEVTIEFIRNKNLWRSENILEILKEREKCLKILDNKTKKLNYLQQNRLIYTFQKNIVKNKKYSKYLPWFQLAEKTLDKLNRKTWFDAYLKDDIFAEIIRRISKDNLKEKDYTYIQDYNLFWEQVKRFEEALIDEGREEGQRIQEEKQHQEKIEIASKCKMKGMTFSVITDLTGLSKEEIENL